MSPEDVSCPGVLSSPSGRSMVQTKDTEEWILVRLRRSVASVNQSPPPLPDYGLSKDPFDSE